MSRRQRINRQQLATIEANLTDLDWTLLNQVARFRLMSARQLQQVHYGDQHRDERRCRRHLARLV